MPTVQAEDLRQLGAACFEKVSVPTDEATLTARLMVEANLVGHDSHGMRQLSRYVSRIEEGLIVAGAPTETVRETPVTALLDGHHNLGYVAAARATQKAIAMAQQTGLSAVGVRNLNHVGRIGAYPEMIAAAGLVGLVTVNVQARGILVAPFGGLQARLGTNPFGAAFPRNGNPPILLDFATSAVAANKVRQAKSREKPAGEGWLQDAAGAPTTDPQAFIDGQATLLPLGGTEGYKGYALGVMVDILSGILAGAGSAVTDQRDINNGTFIICIDPKAFLDDAQYQSELDALVAHLKNTSPRPGHTGVELPGEYEHNNRVARTRDGIPIESPVWEDIAACATRLGVPLPKAD